METLNTLRSNNGSLNFVPHQIQSMHSNSTILYTWKEQANIHTYIWQHAKLSGLPGKSQSLFEPSNECNNIPPSPALCRPRISKTLQTNQQTNQVQFTVRCKACTWGRPPTDQPSTVYCTIRCGASSHQEVVGLEQVLRVAALKISV